VPFVLGADAILTRLRALQVGPGFGPFRLLFSASPFPGALELRRLDEEDGGVRYEAALGDEALRGWLCGHFFDYFANCAAGRPRQSRTARVTFQHGR
jgi:hypothetical protein